MAIGKFKSKALIAGYRSGLEEKVGTELEQAGVKAEYEPFRIPYTIPESKHHYTPDYVLPNGIIIETKGRFMAADRKKHTLIQKQHPGLDIRFVFGNPNAKLRKGSPTTYADWCEKNGFKYAGKSVPTEWVNEKPVRESIKIIANIRKVPCRKKKTSP